MPDILAGATVKAVDFPAAAFALDDTPQADIASTTYVTGTPVVDVTFTAPTSGRVLLIVGAAMRDDIGNDKGHVAPEVYLGTDATGTLVLAAADDNAVHSINVASDYAHYSQAGTLPGLTPGATYYARTMHRADAVSSTVDIAIRDLNVIPVT